MLHWFNSPWLWLGLLATPLALLGIRHLRDPWVRFRLRMTEWRKAAANLFTPFSVIAAELRRMNDLKEQEMAERLNPKTGEKDPIYVIKELPSPDDTSVFWGSDDEPKGIAGLRAKLAKKWDELGGGEEEE